MNEATESSKPKSICLVEDAFSTCFFKEFKTILTGGAKEPIYLPAKTKNEPNRLYYRGDYISSALHEAAHWCLAGDDRRERIDFGYWYIPEGRDTWQQANFESMEARPQALEWFFSLASNCRFHLSLDNYCNLAEYNRKAFAQSVVQQAETFIIQGLPNRANLFFLELTKSFGTSLIPNEIQFETNSLL